MKGIRGVTAYQHELLTTLSRLEQATGRLTDFDQLLGQLSWTPSKESAQFTIRAMIAKGFIEKAAIEPRRGRNRICYRVADGGKAVLDPRWTVAAAMLGAEEPLPFLMPELLEAVTKSLSSRVF